MASVVSTAKLSARIASRYAPRHPSRRGFRTSARRYAAQNYTMPALSPTMTEGNVASWKMKEGDSFTAGDVILEIETDKATMDVEAQDDGVLFKIMQGDGAKGVQVGQRIAVMAEQGDDLGSLEVPADESTSSASSEQAGQEQETEQKEEKSAEESPEGGSREITSGASDPDISKPFASTSTSSGTEPSGKKQPYPLLPATQHTLHENGLSSSDADKITPSGPQGRLLKGDVLAYLGKISKDYPAESSARLEKLTHLDLSNIELAQPKAKATDIPTGKAETISEPELPKETEIALPISLSAVIATQKRVQDTLGIFLPLSTFVARASEMANEDLPPSRRKPTADDLFNSILGLDAVSSKHSRGHFIPQVTAILPISPVPARRPKKADIIDLLAASKVGKARQVPPQAIPAALGVAAGDNVFSVSARPGEERRATEYLERMKLALEKEPGRLVL